MRVLMMLAVLACSALALPTPISAADQPDQQQEAAPLSLLQMPQKRHMSATSLHARLDARDRAREERKRIHKAAIAAKMGIDLPQTRGKGLRETLRDIKKSGTSKHKRKDRKRRHHL